MIGLDPAVYLGPCPHQNTLNEVLRQVLQRGLLREIAPGGHRRLDLIVRHAVDPHQVSQGAIVTNKYKLLISKEDVILEDIINIINDIEFVNKDIKKLELSK